MKFFCRPMQGLTEKSFRHTSLDELKTINTIFHPEEISNRRV